jgi:RNA polymerase sigma-70 factor (ECF subfamily)
LAEGICLDENSDQMLVSAVKKGDKQAYTLLVRKYYKQVFAVCFGILGNADDAEDIAQDTMLTGYLKIKELHRTGHFSGWILRIARNLCIDLLRRKKHVKSILAEQSYEHSQNSSNHSDIGQQIRKLPLDLRLPLVMYYFDNKNAKNIAETLNISHSSACAKLKEAKKLLHSFLTGREK